MFCAPFTHLPHPPPRAVGPGGVVGPSRKHAKLAPPEIGSPERIFCIFHRCTRAKILKRDVFQILRGAKNAYIYCNRRRRRRKFFLATSKMYVLKLIAPPKTCVLGSLKVITPRKHVTWPEPTARGGGGMGGLGE